MFACIDREFLDPSGSELDLDCDLCNLWMLFYIISISNTAEIIVASRTGLKYNLFRGTR